MKFRSETRFLIFLPIKKSFAFFQKFNKNQNKTMEPEEQLQEQPTNGQHVLENPVQSAEIQIREEPKQEISLVSGFFSFFFPYFFF